MRFCLFFAMASVTALAADDPYAAQLFQKHCASCHNSEAGAGGRVPQIAALKSMTPAAIQKTLESGVMKQQAAALSPDERQKIASFLGTAVTLEKKRDEIANLCPAGATAGESPAWASWGGGFRQYAIPIGERCGASGGRLAAAETEVGIRIPGHVHHAFPARRLSGQSIRRRAGRQRLRARYEDRLRVLGYDRAVPGALGHYGGRGRRESRVVLRRFRRVRLCAGRNVREAVVEGARGRASGIH